MTEQELIDAISAGERPGVEFKNARSRTDPSFVEIARAALGMANRRDGGVIVIGVNDDGNATGLTPVQAATWSVPDPVRQALSPLADPYVYLDVELVTISSGPLANRQFAVLKVQEFDQMPVLCAQRRFGTNGAEVLKQGACYVRPNHMPATTEIANQQQMREVLDLAIEKGVRRFLQRARRAGLDLQVAPGDDDLFAAQRRDFDE